MASVADPVGGNIAVAAGEGRVIPDGAVIDVDLRRRGTRRVPGQLQLVPLFATVKGSPGTEAPSGTGGGPAADGGTASRHHGLRHLDVVDPPVAPVEVEVAREVEADLDLLPPQLTSEAV